MLIFFRYMYGNKGFYKKCEEMIGTYREYFEDVKVRLCNMRELAVVPSHLQMHYVAEMNVLQMKLHVLQALHGLDSLYDSLAVSWHRESEIERDERMARRIAGMKQPMGYGFTAVEDEAIRANLDALVKRLHEAIIEYGRLEMHLIGLQPLDVSGDIAVGQDEGDVEGRDFRAMTRLAMSWCYTITSTKSCDEVLDEFLRLFEENDERMRQNVVPSLMRTPAFGADHLLDDGRMARLDKMFSSLCVLGALLEKGVPMSEVLQLVNQYKRSRYAESVYHSGKMYEFVKRLQSK